MTQHLDLDALQAAAEAATPGPWSVCRHLESMEADLACSCGYRGVVFGPEENVPMAVCQSGHDPEPVGEEGLGPQSYPRSQQIADMQFITAFNPQTALALIDRLRKAEAASKWQPIETAPKDKRVLVRTEREIYAAHWGKNPFTDDEAWVVAEWGEDREQALVKPVEWMPLPAAPTSADSEGDR